MNRIFGENTLYVQRMFSTMNPSCYTEYQEDKMEGGVDTRNFGLLAQRVRNAAYRKRPLRFMTLNDRERPDWSKKHVYDSRTSDRTRFIESYENAKKMAAESWKDYEDTKQRRDRGELDGKRDSPDTIVKWAKDYAKADDEAVEEFKRGLAEMDYKKSKGINYVPRLSNYDWWRWSDREGDSPEKAIRR